MVRYKLFAFVLGLFFLPLTVRAEIVESQLRVPVSFDWHGETQTREVVVTRFQDNERKPSRFMVILHGRAVTSAERASMGRARYVDIARAFASQGYAVFVPTRIGYGETGGPDIENSGPCRDKNYISGTAASASVMEKIIAALRAEKDIGHSGGVIIGQSAGGLLTTALAARNVPRINAYVNFAGGAGGNPKDKPAQPCDADRLSLAFATYGKTARTPMLWLYSENDQFWGARLPREWFAAFRKAGGRGQFVALPPFSSDGHRSFVGNPSAWREPVQQFLDKPR